MGKAPEKKKKFWLSIAFLLLSEPWAGTLNGV